MGFGTLGRIAGNYNSANDKITGDTAVVSGGENADNFLGNWIQNKLPEMVTNLAIRVVDDGSATVAKEVLDASKGEGFFGGLFK